jgi:hypothetical protein
LSAVDVVDARRNVTELSCGFVILELRSDDETLKFSKVVTLPVTGGTLYAQRAIDENEVIARRSGWRSVTQKLGGKGKAGG